MQLVADPWHLFPILLLMLTSSYQLACQAELQGSYLLP